MVTMRSQTERISGSSEEIDNDGDARLGHLDQETVNFDFRADVDATGRFVDDQDLRPQRQPPRQNDFLLVSAREVARRLVGARHANVEQASEFADQPILGGAHR